MWMKKLLLSLALTLGLAAAPVLAASANYYADGGCTNNGDGLTCDGTHKLGDVECDDIANWVCAATGGGAGPFNDYKTALQKPNPGATDDQKVIFAGTHAASAHTVSSANHATGTFDGRYPPDITSKEPVIANSGHDGHPVIYEPLGYTTLQGGTEQVVWLEGGQTVATGSWGRCSDCTTGICTGVGGTCSNTWYASATQVAYASDPAIYYGGTYVDSGEVKWLKFMASPSELSESKVCATSTGDSNYILASFGTSVPSKVTIIRGRRDLVGYTADYLTFRGINMEAGARAFLEPADTTAHTNMTIQDGHFRYDYDHDSGSARMLTLTSSLNSLIEYNKFEYADNEPLHFDTWATASTVSAIIRYNYIHNISSLFGYCGTGCVGYATPNCTTFGGQTSDTGDYDYTGFEFYGNFIDGCASYALLVEADSKGQKIHDNFIIRAGDCFRFNNEGWPQKDAEVYNNICISPGFGNPGGGLYNSAEGDCFRIRGSSSPLDGHKIYNNVCYNPSGWGLVQEVTTPTNTLIANNIFYSPNSQQLVKWETTNDTNSFVNNITKSNTTSTLVNWKGVTYTCNGINQGYLGVGDKCLNPRFVSEAGGDFRTYPYGPEYDKGTSILGTCSITKSFFCASSSACPVGETCTAPNRTTGFTNPLMATYGYLPMAEGYIKTGKAWDIGAFESVVADANFEEANAAAWVASPEDCDVSGAGFAATPDGSDPYSLHGNGVGVIRASTVGTTCGSLSQTLAGLDTARTYTVYFDYLVDNAANHTITVQVDGSNICTITTNALSPNWAYSPSTCTFTPAGASAVLTFIRAHITSGDPVTFNFDNVRVQATN